MSRSTRAARREAIACGGLLAAALGATAVCAQPAPAVPKTIALLAATLPIADVDRAAAFYTKGLGLTFPGPMDSPGAIEAPMLFPNGQGTLILLKSKTPPSPGDRPRLGRVILDVADLRALQSRLEAAGYPLAGPIVEQKAHHVLVALVKDPDGNELELVQRPR
jgi:predicted enzyme related to lactoylglutathione lyase